MNYKTMNEIRAKELAAKIEEFTGKVYDAKFTISQIAKFAGFDGEYVRSFLRKYPRGNVTQNERFEIMKKILPYRVISDGHPVVFAYGLVKPPVKDTKIVKIEYPIKKSESATRNDKTPEEYLSEIKNEILVLSRIGDEIVRTQKAILEVQADTYNLFKEIRDGKKK